MARPRRVGARERGAIAGALVELFEGFARSAARNATALGQGDVYPGDVIVPSERTVDRLRSALLSVGFGEAETVAGIGKALGRVDTPAVRARAVAYADRQAAILVRELSDDARDRLREIIANHLTLVQGRGAVSYPVPGFGPRLVPGRSLRGETFTQSLAGRLRGEVGLTSRQVATVERFRVDLLRELAGGPKPSRALASARRARVRSVGDVDRLTRQYGEAWRRYRAETIAATETHSALMAGRQAAWAEMGAAGKLPPGARQVWMINDSDRTCPRCEALDGVTVGLAGGLWHDELGGVMAERPPLHPRCRCWIDVVAG